ncbi:SDR family oxidoreductase [Zunongwangia sp. SCSIO 43204]|uniref:SDR family NAD(P)-dependent oxidoreductase n=1 Tax=Zunongwangia sp. SCSIO 43204 TaxID=2779359 RepID=UPI001CA9D793|nr:SDR family oxidoreductase [Zunongwangia sp. SCSIO 43204]UAB83135.1 SDR family oxidoreductase [Zunongwangia sp. SCSIO 43204]
MKKLENKVAIITGAASGMGAAEAKLFAKAGAKVVGTDVQKEKLKSFFDELESDGYDVMCLVHDVSSEEDWKTVVDTTIKQYGKVDILVNNAGIPGKEGFLEDVDIDNYRKVIDINLTSQIIGMQVLASYMKENGGGSIVNISSIAGIVGTAGGSNVGYAGSKGGSRMITKAVAVEMGKSNIRVNSVHPGIIETPLLDNFNDEIKEALSKNIPMARLGNPIEVANAVLFLASDDASYITGIELIVDGGTPPNNAIVYGSTKVA